MVLAGGSGLLGRRLADDFARRGFEVVVLSRTPDERARHRQVHWDGRTVGGWAKELEGATVVNLAGALVDRPATATNVGLLTRSRVEPTRALAEAAASCEVPPVLWLQMSTLAIYGDAGAVELVEGSGIGSPRPQMTGVAQAWEDAAEGVRADRSVVLRTGIVLDADSPAMDRLVGLTRWGLGGQISTGDQWVSWIHIDDFLAAVRRLVDDPGIDGIVHITAPNPVRNREMMSSLRSAVGRPWAPPTPAPFVRIGARFLRTDPDLALTGRRCIPRRLLDQGMEFEFATFDDAIRDLVGSGPSITVRRPAPERIEAYRSKRIATQPTTPPAGSPPPRYRRDAFRRVVGHGDHDFDRACDGLRRWVPHRSASVDVAPADARLEAGSTVAVVMRQPGTWILAACRIVAVVDESDRFGFTYATLPGHLVDGYESFTVVRYGDEVVFEVEMVARPASLLIRLAGPIGRLLQRRAVDGYLTGLQRWVGASPT